jgi:hypothetical protein
METVDLIKQIKLLPRNQRFYVVEETLKSIRKEETTYQIETTVEALYDDYLNNKELTAFTDLDLEDFYETK